MPTKSITFNAALEPLTQPLPSDIAAGIGAIVQRHAYLDWLLGQVMYSLMEISIKQGRVIMKLPRPRVYIAAVKELFDFHGLATRFDFDELAKCLEAAENARRELTRSVYMRDTDSRALRIQLARSPWDPGPGGDTQPEAQLLDARHLARKRKDVEDAIRCAGKLRALTDKQLRVRHRSRLAASRRK
jgi:hypothetical protein